MWALKILLGEMRTFRVFSQSTTSGSSNGHVLNTSQTTGSDNGLMQKRGMVLPFTPLSMSFDDVNYYVDMPPVRKFFSLFISVFLFVAVHI
jgi:hypothetical protein